MRITQGTFSYLPDLTDEQIEAQLRYALRNGWAIMVEHTDDPHPRNALWEMWAPPQFDLIEDDVDVAMREMRAGARGVAARVREGGLLRPLARAPDDGAGLHRRAPAGRARLPRSSARRRPTARSATRSTPTRPTRPPGSATARRARRRPTADAARDRGRCAARARRRRATSRACSRSSIADLVALEPVKTRIREIAALLVIDRLRREQGLACARPSLHMSFTGNPGTGKTTVALRMAEILHRLGYIEKPKVVSVTRDDLVGQYVGHTAPKTREVLKRARGGVLFIDEAYYLYRPENERDYGQEAIEILLQVMEAERDDLVVVLAGYRDRMETFFRSNPGMGSRVAHHIHFPDFDVRRADGDRGADARPAGLRAHGRRARGAARVRRAARPARRASRTGAASATRSTARACARPAGSTTRRDGAQRAGPGDHRGRGHPRQLRLRRRGRRPESDERDASARERS